MTDVRTAPGPQRVAALMLLLVAGLLSLPVAAFALDGEDTENLIVPAQLAGMALLGALVGRLLPGLAGEGASASRGVWVGLGAGLAFAVLGVVLFFVLLNGFDGA